jgi:hypothetical protein
MLREFARREARQSGGEVAVYQLKLSTELRRGPVPEMRVRARKGAPFLVSVRRGTEMRIYFFDGRGAMVGADNYRAPSKELERLLSRYRRVPL